jgi:hypothetical protein
LDGYGDLFDFTAQFPELQKRQQARAQREAEENY